MYFHIMLLYLNKIQECYCFVRRQK